MKQKILTLFLALAASVGTMFAEVVKIGDLYYDLDVVYKNAYVVPNPNGKYSGDIIIPPTVEDNNSIVYNVTYILKYAFKDCTELTSVTIPNSITNIDGLAFQNCTSLTDIIIPEGVTAILDQVFFNCSGLTSVTLPKSLTVIGQLAFYKCTSLTDIIIPEGVTELYNSTFEQCSALTSVTIPSSVTRIRNYAFYGCSNLTDITCQAVVPPTCDEQVFGNVPKTIPVYVPKGSVAAYKAADKWADFGDNIQVKKGTKQMTPGIAHLSWDKNNNQWGITAYDNGDNPQFVFTFSKDGDKGTLPVSMTLSDNTDDICAFADINDASFGGTIKDAAITITYDGNGYQYDNVGKRHYVMAKISGEVSNAYHKLIVNEPADYIKVFVPSPEEIYAVWDEPNTTLTLYYNDQRIAQNGETDWSSYASTATTVVLDASMQDARPTSTAKWFFTFSKMTAIQNLEYLNTSEVTEMSAMFLGCSALTALDLSKFNTENVTNMNGMFYACSSLTSLDLSNFNTAKVEDMSYMFRACRSLTSLDVSSFNTANVTNMNYMFYYCYLLTSLDLSNFNTAKVTGMSGMFEGCESLKTIYCDDTWNPSSSDNMFYNCTALVGGKGTEYDANHIDKTYARPDGLGDQPGYFTAKSAPITPEEQKEIDAVIDLINAIGTVTYTPECKARIDAARSAYDALTAEQKVYITDATYKILTDAEQAYADLKANAEAVANAKLQLKNIVSQANELKMVAMIYAPTAVTDIDAIINDAQSMIDDPNATVDQVNAKAATLTDNLNTLAVNLLDQAKEQLKQSIIAIFLPDDYPSWYDAVITPALNQVDGVTWDFNKSVNENIVFFQATGTQIYNDTKSALEALRASDTRSIVTACAFTGFEPGIKVDMTWNISALNNLINTLNASVASEPYRLDVEMSSLGKWDPTNATLVVLDPHTEEKLTAGDYQFITAVRIDGEEAKQYRLPKATEEVLSVSVDATPWAVDLSGIVIDVTYCYTVVNSPMFTVSNVPTDVELTQEDQLKTQKIFRDGHFYILRGEHIYDLQGTLVR